MNNSQPVQQRPIILTADEKMWIAAEMLTFAVEYHQWKTTPQFMKSFNADKNALSRVNWIERVVLSGKPIDSPEFQG